MFTYMRHFKWLRINLFQPAPPPNRWQPSWIFYRIIVLVILSGIASSVSPSLERIKGLTIETSVSHIRYAGNSGCAAIAYLLHIQCKSQLNLPILSTKPVRSSSRLFREEESDARLFIFLSLCKMISFTC